MCISASVGAEVGGLREQPQVDQCVHCVFKVLFC